MTWLIPPALGGSNDDVNLWPRRNGDPRARWIRRSVGALRARLCNGEIELPEAQRQAAAIALGSSATATPTTATPTTATPTTATPTTATPTTATPTTATPTTATPTTATPTTATPTTATPTTATPTTATPTTATPTSSATGAFRVTTSGRIEAPDGSDFVPIGANVGVDSNNYGWHGDALGHSDAAVKWGWNMIRTNVELYPEWQDTANDNRTSRRDH